MISEYIRVAWVDDSRLTRECMTIALAQADAPISFATYGSFTEFLERCAVSDVDLIVLRARSLEDILPQQVASLRQAGFAQPVVLVMDNDEAGQIAAVKHSFGLGASGHLSTRSTSIEMAIASLVFANEGGTFASLDVLLSEDPQERRTPPRSFGRGARDAREAEEGASPRAPATPSAKARSSGKSGTPRSSARRTSPRSGRGQEK